MKPQIENLGKVSVTVEKKYWTKDRPYDRLTIVHDTTTIASYISRKDVPVGINIENNPEYWIPLGRVSDYLKEFVDNEKVTLNDLAESVRNALEDNQEFHDTAYNDIQSLMASFNETITNTLNTINSNNTTFESNENDRKQAESARENAEDNRVTKENERNSAEALRQSAENERKLAEEKRQFEYINQYNAYEHDRRNAETLRNAAESSRQEQEVYRISNEENRQNAESIRQGNENVRNSSETSRQQGEQARVKAENNRVTAEINRQLQEGNYSDKPDANGSRWARFHQAQTERSTIAQQEENARNTTFNTAESTRQTTFTTNEGKSTDSADASGSRWARFNKTMNDATTTLNNKITEIQNKANQDLGDLNELAETAANIEEILENKANIDGNYESMTAGHAIYSSRKSIMANVNWGGFTTKNKSLYQTDSELTLDYFVPIFGYYHQLINANYEYIENDITVTCSGNTIHIKGTLLANQKLTIYPNDVNTHKLITFIGLIYSTKFNNNNFTLYINANNNTYNATTYDTINNYKMTYYGRNDVMNTLSIQISTNKNIELDDDFIIIGANSILLCPLKYSNSIINDYPSGCVKKLIGLLSYIGVDKLKGINYGEVINPDISIKAGTNDNIIWTGNKYKGNIDDDFNIIKDDTSRLYVVEHIGVEPNSIYFTYKNDTIKIIYYDRYKNKLYGESISGEIITPNDCYYVSICAYSPALRTKNYTDSFETNYTTKTISANQLTIQVSSIYNNNTGDNSLLQLNYFTPNIIYFNDKQVLMNSTFDIIDSHNYTLTTIDDTTILSYKLPTLNMTTLSERHVYIKYNDHLYKPSRFNASSTTIDNILNNNNVGIVIYQNYYYLLICIKAINEIENIINNLTIINIQGTFGSTINKMPLIDYPKISINATISTITSLTPYVFYNNNIKVNTIDTYIAQNCINTITLGRLLKVLSTITNKTITMTNGNGGQTFTVK